MTKSLRGNGLVRLSERRVVDSDVEGAIRETNLNEYLTKLARSSLLVESVEVESKSH